MSTLYIPNDFSRTTFYINERPQWMQAERMENCDRGIAARSVLSEGIRQQIIRLFVGKKAC